MVRILDGNPEIGAHVLHVVDWLLAMAREHVLTLVPYRRTVKFDLFKVYDDVNDVWLFNYSKQTNQWQ